MKGQNEELALQPSPVSCSLIPRRSPSALTPTLSPLHKIPPGEEDQGLVSRHSSPLHFSDSAGPQRGPSHEAEHLTTNTVSARVRQADVR